MLTKFGIEVTFVDMTNPQTIEQAIRKNTKLLFLETPINPNLVVLDLDAILKITKKHQIISVVDNTF